MKKCAKCNNEKPISEFRKKKGAKDGLYSQCLACDRESRRISYHKHAKKNKEKARKIFNNWREKNPEKYKASCKENRKKWRLKNPEKYVEIYKRSSKKQREKNPEKARMYVANWVKNNREKYLECNRISSKKWRENNRDLNAARVRRRQASKLKAVPKWANDFFVKEIYHLAKLRIQMTGIEWHVDHIVPLQSDIVCGLHWKKNMQVITKSENLSKGNRYWPDMP